MEIETNGGTVKIDYDDQKMYESASEALCNIIDSIPELIARAVNSFIRSKEALRPEENVFVDFDAMSKKPQVLVTLRPINEYEDFINIRFPLWAVIKNAVKNEDSKDMLRAAKELRGMAEFIENKMKNQKIPTLRRQK